MTLRICRDKGGESLIDVSGLIETFRVHAPLRRPPELFRQVRLGGRGTDVVWNGEIHMAAETLWRLAQEQSVATISPGAFRRWRERKAYTLDAAARAWARSPHGRLFRARRETDSAYRRARRARSNLRDARMDLRRSAPRGLRRRRTQSGAVAGVV